MYYPPITLFLTGLLCAFYAALVGNRIAWLRTVSRCLAGLFVLAALLLAQSVSAVCCGIVGVTPIEIAAFRSIFEEALRRADIPISAASIWLYGKEDHSRLRKELNGEGGGVSFVRAFRLPAKFWREVLTLISDDKQLDIITAQDIERVARLLAVAPKPQPATVQETVWTPSASRA